MSMKSPCNGGKYVPQHYPEETDLLSFPCYRIGIMGDDCVWRLSARRELHGWLQRMLFNVMRCPVVTFENWLT